MRPFRCYACGITTCLGGRQLFGLLHKFRRETLLLPEAVITDADLPPEQLERFRLSEAIQLRRQRPLCRGALLRLRYSRTEWLPVRGDEVQVLTC
jgi:hypothetical protein